MKYESKNNDESFIGEKFGKLTVVNFAWNGRRWNWVCKCDCGNIKEVNPSRVKAGDIQSC